MAFEKQFEILGFSQNERLVFIELAQSGKSNAQTLANLLNIPRPTVYWTLEQLQKKGVVSLERRKGVSFFSLNHPSGLVRLVQKEREEALLLLSAREEAARQVADGIRPAAKARTAASPRIQIFQGREAVDALLYDYLPVWQDSISAYDNTWWGYQDHSFAEHYTSWLRHAWKLKRTSETYKVLTNRAPVEERLATVAPHRRMKFVPPQFEFSSSIWAVGDYLVLLMTKQSPHYAMQLKNSDFTASIRGIFRLLWDNLPAK